MSGPPPRRTALTLRLLGVVAAALLLLGLVVGISRDRNPEDRGGSPTSIGPGPPEPTNDEAAQASDTTAPPPAPDVTLLHDPARAEEAGAEAVLAAGRRAATAEWADLTAPAWLPALDREQPVYVGRLTVAPDGAVEGDLVIATRASDGGPFALRFLPGAAVLQEAGSSVDVDVRVDGAAVVANLDPDGALLTVTPTSDVAPGDAVLLRVRFAYVVPERAAIRDDGGPAGFGLLARSPGITMLGHAFPVVTFDAAPMVSWGDVGAFPVATWSVQIHADAQVVTGGDETACPPVDGRGCTVARGTALRDLAVAVVGHPASPATFVEGSGVRAIAPGPQPLLPDLHAEAVGSMASLTRRLGPLPWRSTEVVLAPLTQAAGMEFPGLVLVDPEYLDRLEGGFGTFVVSHEMAHQWFHALVGNSSLADPVVDESIAQFTSLWYLRDGFGEEVAQRIVDRNLVRRYLAAKERGVREQAPASSLADFGSNEVYGPMTYSRGAYAWVAAEAEAGAAGIEAILAAFVSRFGLREATTGDLLALVTEVAPSALDTLVLFWTSPEPVSDRLR